MFVLPIANVMRIYQNEKIVTDETMQRQLLSSFFPDRHYLYVPPNLQITSTKMEAREEKRWVFPEGTTFIHEIYFKSNHAALPLEVRFEKMDNGNFRYGVYEAIKADSKSHCDTMQLRDGSATAYRDLSSRDNDLGEIRFHLQPRSPTECIGCHAMSEEVTTLAGANRPCAFEKYTTTRTIHANISEWVSKYRERFNHSPFDEDK
jgi:hypothetical protein